MHFSVPDWQELYSEATGTTYTGYNVYINGAFHCCLRYKQLHALHEQLRRRCQLVGVQLPDFPPKRLLPLTIGQVETRRAALEHYLQLVGQDGRVAKLELFQKFLLSAQLETALSDGALDEYGSTAEEVPLQVMLSDECQLEVLGRVCDNAAQVLQKACAGLQVPAPLVARFCIFLVRKDAKEGHLVLLRRLLDFEAPCVSRLRAMPCQILLRTAYWSPSLDAALLQHRVTLHLLYVQAVSDVQHEWVIASPAEQEQLGELQERSLKREYVELVRRLPLYGCLQFAEALVDYPEPQTRALVAVGNRELSMRTSKGAKIYETKFRVTRMRCWRVTAIHNTAASVGPGPGELHGASSAKEAPANLQLSFEYLMAKQSLRWVTITSAQAMLISVCLQAMVDELMASKEGHSRQPSDNTDAPSLASSSSASSSSASARMQANGHRSQSTVSSSSSSHSFSNEGATSSSAASNSDSSKSPSPTSPPIQFITQRRTMPHNPKIATTSQSYSGVFFRNAQANAVQRNEAFEGIGDDDL